MFLQIWSVPVIVPGIVGISFIDRVPILDVTEGEQDPETIHLYW